MSILRSDSIKNRAGTGAPDFPNGATVTGVVTATSFVGSGANLTGVGVGTADSINTSGIITATTVSVGGSITAGNKLYGDGSSLTGLASREIYGFTGIGSHLQLTYSNNGADNISGTDFAAFEDEFIGPSGITWSINNDGNLTATI